MKLSSVLKKYDFDDTLLIAQSDLNEGINDFFASMFFIDPKNDKVSVDGDRSVKKEDDEPAARPFGGVCSYMKSVLIPERHDYRADDEKLINAAAQMFRGNWVNKKEAQNCIKSVLSHLLKKYLNQYDNNINDIDMHMMADSIADGELHYSSSHSDFKMVQRVFKRIHHHKERIINDMIDNPENFKKKWIDSKTELAKVIENVLKIGGETNMYLGQTAASLEDAAKGKK